MDDYKKSLTQIIIIACFFLATNISLLLFRSEGDSGISGKSSSGLSKGNSGNFSYPAISNSSTFNFSSALNEFSKNAGYEYKINSWFRSESENAHVGGSSNSNHLRGLAVDVSLPDGFNAWTEDAQNTWLSEIAIKWKNAIQKYGFSGSTAIGKNHVHLDVGYQSYGGFRLWNEINGKIYNFTKKVWE